MQVLVGIACVLSCANQALIGLTAPCEAVTAQSFIQPVGLTVPHCSGSSGGAPVAGVRVRSGSPASRAPTVGAIVPGRSPL